MLTLGTAQVLIICEFVIYKLALAPLKFDFTKKKQPTSSRGSSGSYKNSDKSSRSSSSCSGECSSSNGCLVVAVIVVVIVAVVDIIKR